ncbi:MAG: MarR family winged helix-turn-helix transcriptional regulator [Saprospiraceae bacterium]
MDPDVHPYESLVFLTNRVGRQLSRCCLSHAVGPNGWQPQPTQMGLLADLMKEDGQTQQELAISTIKDKGTVARALTGLENAGMVRRKPDPRDGRNKLIYLTPAGREFIETMMPVLNNAAHHATRGVDPADLKACLTTLNQIYHNLHTILSPTEQSDRP